jgi:hypothetical protein
MANLKFQYFFFIFLKLSTFLVFETLSIEFWLIDWNRIMECWIWHCEQEQVLFVGWPLNHWKTENSHWNQTFGCLVLLVLVWNWMISYVSSLKSFEDIKFIWKWYLFSVGDCHTTRTLPRYWCRSHQLQTSVSLVSFINEREKHKWWNVCDSVQFIPFQLLCIAFDTENQNLHRSYRFLMIVRKYSKK